MDLLDLWRGTLTPRKLSVLAQWLPPGSAVWRSMDIDAGWSDEAHLLAFTADVLQVANWQRGEGKGGKPKPLWRPGDDTRSKTKAAQIAAKAERFRAREAARQRQEG